MTLILLFGLASLACAGVILFCLAMAAWASAPRNERHDLGRRLRWSHPHWKL